MPVLYCDETYGVIAKAATVNMPPAPDASMYVGGAKELEILPASGTEDGIVVMIGSFSAMPPYGNGTYFSSIIFHCEGKEDVVVYLEGHAANMIGKPMDSVTIHQIPEPASMLLLGLGSLLLRRRK